MVDSFEGPITAREGKQGERLVVTESSKRKASGLFATRESAGASSEERRRNLALPESNSADVEVEIELTRDQMLLEGRVAPQPNFGEDATGGGQQVVTDAFNDGIRRVDETQ